MAIAIMISTFGCNNGLILSGARSTTADGARQSFFAKAGELHTTYRTPALALIVQAVWTCLLSTLGHVQ